MYILLSVLKSTWIFVLISARSRLTIIEALLTLAIQIFSAVCSEIGKILLSVVKCRRCYFNQSEAATVKTTDVGAQTDVSRKLGRSQART